MTKYLLGSTYQNNPFSLNCKERCINFFKTFKLFIRMNILIPVRCLICSMKCEYKRLIIFTSWRYFKVNYTTMRTSKMKFVFFDFKWFRYMSKSFQISIVPIGQVTVKIYLQLNIYNIVEVIVVCYLNDLSRIYVQSC